MVTKAYLSGNHGGKSKVAKEYSSDASRVWEWQKQLKTEGEKSTRRPKKLNMRKWMLIKS